MTPSAPGSDLARCPRCGDAFLCGAAAPDPCACSTVHLAAPLLAALRERYRGCLCLTCLQALARSEALGAD
ncbi:MAG: cysteine-rich CWC family protein [Pseudomonadota bacterium]|nr:cysteine-rich CWC family protein [Pseudomonadota bacterium]